MGFGTWWKPLGGEKACVKINRGRVEQMPNGVALDDVIFRLTELASQITSRRRRHGPAAQREK